MHVALAAAAALSLCCGLVMFAGWAWVTFHAAAGIVIAAMILPVVGFVIYTLVRRDETVSPKAVAPGLHDDQLPRLADDIGRRLGVVDLPELRIGLRPQVTMDIGEGRPVLVVGAPLLWGLPADQLAARLAEQIAMMPDVTPRLVQAFGLRRRLRQARMHSNQGPLVGWLVRLFAQAIEHRLDVLAELCATAGRSRAAAAGYVQPEPSADGDLVADAWDMFVSAWVRPAIDVGVAVNSLGSGFVSMLAEFRSAGVIDTAETPPLLSPDGEGRSLDESTSRVLSEYHDLPIERWIGWSEYDDAVVSPRDRARTAALFAACDIATGHANTATVESVVSLLESGWARTIVAVLDPTVADDEEAAASVLAYHLVSAVRVALVDAGAATRRRDWVRGLLLVRPDGSEVPLAAALGSLMTTGSGAEVRQLMEGIGVSPDTLILMAGTDAPPDRALFAMYGYRRWQGLFVVLSRDEILLLKGRSPHVRTWRDIVGRSTIIETFDDVVGRPVAHVTDRYEVVDRVRLSDVVAAQIHARRGRVRWRVVLRTSQRIVRFSGYGTGAQLAAALEARLRDRLAASGPITSDPRRRMNRGIIGRAMLAVGAVLMAVGLFFGYAATTSTYPAHLQSCQYVKSNSSYADCVVRVDAPIDHDTATVRIPSPPAGTVEVHAVRLPFVDDVVVQGWLAWNMFMLFGTVGALAILIGVISLVRRARFIRPRE